MLSFIRARLYRGSPKQKLGGKGWKTNRVIYNCPGCLGLCWSWLGLGFKSEKDLEVFGFKSEKDLEILMTKERKKGTCVAPIYLYPGTEIEERTIVWIRNQANQSGFSET